jgi:hypothetical protein
MNPALHTTILNDIADKRNYSIIIFSVVLSTVSSIIEYSKMRENWTNENTDEYQSAWNLSSVQYFKQFNAWITKINRW